MKRNSKSQQSVKESDDLSRRRFIASGIAMAGAGLIGSRLLSVPGLAVSAASNDFNKQRKFVSTSFGRIAYVEHGSGPAALFIHGWPLNGYHWRDVIARVSNVRRCIALDTMGLGHTEISAGQNVSLTEQSRMVTAFLDALKIDKLDVVGNDSGGAIAQLLAASGPSRIRSLTLTNCDVHTNFPPAALGPVVAAAEEKTLRLLLKNLLGDVAQLRAAFAVAYQYPERVAHETFKAYLEPILSSDDRAASMERFLTSLDSSHLTSIEDKLKKLTVPTMIVWGTADTLFPLKWAQWLKQTIPGARGVIEVPNGKVFFAEEHPELLSEKLRVLWKETASA